MAITDILQINKIKAELEATRKERDTLKALLAETGGLELHEVRQSVQDLQNQRAAVEREIEEQRAKVTREIEAQQAKASRDLEARLADLRRQREFQEADIASLKAQAAEKRSGLVELDNEILLQSFGFYKPRYELQNSEQYKAKLESIRDQQAALVKAGKAATCPTSWSINGDAKEGERWIRDYTKLIVRSFNNECDASITDVKFSNIEAIEKRIRRAFDALNALARRMSIALTQPYLNLKLQELYLCYEYQVKKQQEKEEQKRLREQMREEARVMKEIEDAKLKLAKEEKHFNQALAALEQRLQQPLSDAERTLVEKEKEQLQQKLAGIEKDKLDVLKREQNTRAGYVYVISNIGAFGENVYKIGVTRRLDPQERIDELGDSSVPFDFDIHALVFSDDAPALETALHQAFAGRKLNMINGRREFFNVTLEEIEAVIKRNFNKPVEVARLADAAEYRQSQRLWSAPLQRSFALS